LRAIAVLSVLCFHWNVRPFFGGFVGVDVFFVISGFLITRLISNETKSGQFSFVRFYERRVRRILPALYVVIAVTCLAAWFLLLPPQMIDLARSIIAVTFFSSNILFWQEAGYFDGPAIVKPLLHTWSLSVEEQFYLIFPALIVIIVRRSAISSEVRNVTAALIVICIGSFAYNVWQVKAEPSSAFYLSPGRAWEFLLGSILAIGRIPTIEGRLVQFFAATLGVVMLLSAVISFRPHTPFPGASALLPCLGTAICIWANTNRMPGALERVLMLLPEFYGKISYSLYLWHWPVWVFAKLWLRPEADFSTSIKFLMFVLTTALSYASYRLIEQPFRNRTAVGRAALLVSGGAASALLLLFGVTGSVFDGFSSRVSPEIAALANYGAYPRAVPYRENICFLQPFQKIQEYDVDECLSAKPNTRNVLLLGDSIAAHYLPGLKRATSGRGISILQANSASCPPFFDLSQPTLLNCDAMNVFVRRRLHIDPPDVVLISANWRYYSEALGYDRFLALLRATIDEIRQNTAVILLGPSIQYEEPLPGLLASLALRGADLTHAQKWVKPVVFDLDKKMSIDFAEIPNLTYVSILGANCPDQRCPLLVGGIPLEWDAVHLTVVGSEKIIAATIPQMAAALFGH
jgi:peptidoglycan/LPS O-acetylase OafA/YrhL